MPYKNLPIAAKSPPASDSIHNALLEKTIPKWLTDATPSSLTALKATPTAMPDWYNNATSAQREALNTATVSSFTSQTALEKAMSNFNDVDAFAKPLLVNALKDQFNLTLDVEKTYLRLRKPLELGILGVDISSFEVLKLPLLQAALHNFEASECEAGAFHDSSGFVIETASPGVFETLDTTLTVVQFIQLCRTLDIGAKYQAYLKGYLAPTDGVAEQVLRQKYITAQKDALRAAAEMALLKKDIRAADYAMILSVIDGEVNPWLEGRPVWFRDLGLMKLRMTGCVVFSICEKYRYSDDVIVYVPNDPEYPLKRYTYTQLKVQFKRQFTAREASSSADSSPSAYQRFFSRFVAYADRPNYFSQFTEDAPGTTFSQTVSPYVPILNQLVRGLNPFLGFKELVPAAPTKQVANNDPYLGVRTLSRVGHGIWAENVDLWAYLYDRHRDQVIADAASHAVPTADVDARVRSRKLAALLNIGMLVLVGISMFVPVLGELLMGVMAGQLLYETFEGAIEWNEGDRKAAKAHLIDVAQNLALIALMAGAGKAFGKLRGVKAEPVIERLEPVTLPNGEVRLWKPGLTSYESDVQLSADLKPNALGEYDVEGKSYIRQGNKVYRKQFDPAINKWRLEHPTDPEAYQPILEHNGQGAWRHTLERPLAWDRSTLLRRVGHATDGLSDATLEKAATVSGVDDSVLRKMHTDSSPMPPALVDTLRQFQVDRQLNEMLRQARAGASVPDNRYNYTLPEVINMPRWPRGRVMDVFDDATLEGRSTRYGQVSPAQKPAIKISRADVASGKLAQRVLENLDEAEIVSLLGAQGARIVAEREAVFRQQLADHLTANKTSLFDSMLEGERLSTPQTPETRALQRVFPSLPTEAAQDVLAGATPAQRMQFVPPATPPATLLLNAREGARLARLNRALTGLHLPSAASSDSQRLALHALEQLPGWSPAVRLEVRQGHMGGRLLDSIGSASAEEVKYLVKNSYNQFESQQFQAFDQQGNALNSVPTHGDNFLASVMHALPDQARARLGVPHVGQVDAFQAAVTDYATANRGPMMEALQPVSRRPGFKAPTRLQDGRVGYPLSGGGSDVQNWADDSLIARVRTVYPGHTDRQALEFINVRRNGGSTNQQIFQLLETRNREFEGLNTVLDTWVQGDITPQWMLWRSRRYFADQIINIWRMGMNRDLESSLQSTDTGGLRDNIYLDLEGAGPLPPLAVDFSHVRTLGLYGGQLNDAALWQTFSRVEGLRIYVLDGEMPALAGELARRNSIKELTLNFGTPPVDYSPALTRAIQGMNQLETLVLSGRPPALDYGALPRLRRLTLLGALEAWPTGVLAHEGLEMVDLARAELRTLPDALFSGQEVFWRRLRINWGGLEPQSFMKAFDYLYESPAHLVDESQMVEQYCTRRFNELARSRYQDPTFTLETFKQKGLEGRSLLDKVEALRKEHQALDTTLADWQGRAGVRVEGELLRSHHRTELTNKIRDCWRNALIEEYGPSPRSSGSSFGTGSPSSTTLDLSGFGVLGDLPELGEIVFQHINCLKLSGAKLSATQMNAFLLRFPNLKELQLHENRLTELPQALETLGSLTDLDLSSNTLTITASTQTRLNRLSALQRLNLSGNRVGSLNVAALKDLVSLNLRATQIRAWPEGVLSLPNLRFLDLSESAVTDIPETVWAGHENLLAGTSLRGCRLSPQAMARAQAWAAPTGYLVREAQVVDRPLGIERQLLAEGSTGGAPVFYPQEVSEQPNLLLALPLDAARADRSLTSAERLQLMDPQLNAAQAIARINDWLAQDLSAAQIENALRQWEGQHSQMIARFNSWIDAPAVRDRNRWVNPTDRRRAADQLLACWRETLRDVRLLEGAASDFRLDLKGLIIGDPPDLPVTFPHVGELDLSGVRITAASDRFLRAFPRLNRLTLNGNRLGVIPEAVMNRTELTHLGLSDNALEFTQALQDQLRSLPDLQVLDLSDNVLNSFDVTGLDRLQRLDLSGNRLSDWPIGVLEAPALTTLDLRNNYDITDIPPDALEPQHATLMAGTNLHDSGLEDQAFIRLREYERQTGRGLGFSAQELDELVGGIREENVSSDSDDEIHPDQEPAQVQKARWFEEVETSSENNQVWDAVMAQDTTGDLAYILAQLRHTRDFTTDRFGLTERVWKILRAAYADPMLSERLMAIARASRHGATCGDGRILLFNALEVEVYEFDALRFIDPTNKGRALLKLSRELFRLAKVEELANARIRLKPETDPAEIRLAYRLGLVDRLELPAQPDSMLYFGISGVTDADLDAAYAEVIASEKTPAFIEQLTARKYWKKYLKEKYPDEFTRLKDTFSEQSSTLLDQYPDMGNAYAERMNELNTQRDAEQKTLLTTLSTREIATLGV